MKQGLAMNHMPTADCTTSDDFHKRLAAPSVILPARSNSEPVSSKEARSGKVRLDSDLLRRLRQSRLLSQRELADECWRRNIQVSIATIKRAELGRAVRFRIARELARCFDLPLTRIVLSSPS